MMDLFKRKKNNANEFFRNFGSSVSGALTFIKKFEKIRLAKEHLKKISKECDKNG